VLATAVAGRVQGLGIIPWRVWLYFCTPFPKNRETWQRFFIFNIAYGIKLDKTAPLRTHCLLEVKYEPAIETLCTIDKQRRPLNYSSGDCTVLLNLAVTYCHSRVGTRAGSHGRKFYRHFGPRIDPLTGGFRYSKAWYSWGPVFDGINACIIVPSSADCPVRPGLVGGWHFLLTVSSFQSKTLLLR